jgi:ferredoxin
VTPFQIRKRLKGMLGMTPTDRPDERCSVTFLLPDGSSRTVQCEPHYSILMAADANGLTISTGRRAGGTCPDGACDLCRVEVLDGSGLTPRGEVELQMMMDHAEGRAHEGRPREKAAVPGPNTRLGCHAKVIGNGARVKVAELFDPDSIRGDDAGS